MYAENFLDSRISPTNLKRHVFLDVKEDGRIEDVEVGPNIPTYKYMAMDVLIMRIVRTRTGYGPELVKRMPSD